MQQDIIAQYQQKAAEAKSQADFYTSKANRYSLFRLLIFGLIIASIYPAVKFDQISILIVATIILLLAFIWLVSRQASFNEQKRYYLDLLAVTENEIGSVQDRTNLYDNGPAYINEKHYYTSDLDIFGKGMLFDLVNRSATPHGNDQLAAWLKSPANKATVLGRQESLKELATRNDWKLSLQARLLFARKEDKNQLPRFFVYLKSPLGLKGEGWLGKYALITPWLLFAAIIGSFFISGLNYAAALIGLFNGSLIFNNAKVIKKTSMVLDGIGKVLGKYAIAFGMIEQDEFQAQYTKDVQSVLRKAQTSANIKQLAVLINRFDYHSNLIVGTFLNVFFLWDIRQMIAIENWKRSNQQYFEEAFDALAEVEALLSLSSLPINYPQWTFPQIVDTENYTLTGKQIAHPLISTTNRVANDYELQDTRKIDIITGSNMAGKSTFLRTIGINTVLALCGAPVCADSMTVSVMTMVTYMRIKDSIAESTSTFKAELDRLKMLLDAVDGDKKVFFLIDEMLRGTNSRDKYLGSKAVIEKLVAQNGVGMVATHDLQIAELEQKYPDYIRNFYFDIQVVDGEMLFDYKIKHGECKTFNATMLLKRIGIEVE